MEEVLISRIRVRKRRSSRIPVNEFAEIIKNGIREPLVLTKGYRLIDGYWRLQAAKARGQQSVPCIFLEES